LPFLLEEEGAGSTAVVVAVAVEEDEKGDKEDVVGEVAALRGEAAAAVNERN